MDKDSETFWNNKEETAGSQRSLQSAMIHRCSWKRVTDETRTSTEQRRRNQDANEEHESPGESVLNSSKAVP